MMQFFILQASTGGGNFLVSWGPIILMFGVIWLFFIRPQAKKQKEQGKFVKELEKGDEVVTSSGIIGRITKLEDTVVTIQVDNKTFMRMTRGSVSKEMTDSFLSAKE